MNNRDVQRLLRADADRFHAELSEIDLDAFRSQVFDRLGLNQDPEDPTATARARDEPGRDGGGQSGATSSQVSSG